MIHGDTADIVAEATRYLTLFAAECGVFDLRERLRKVYREIEHTGTYELTSDELSFGARVAWRNSTRCIGRLNWSSLHVRDMRHLRTAEAIFTELVKHMDYATNGGKIRSAITIFAPQAPGQADIRILNSQLLLYAGYLQHSSILGDPNNCELTAELMRLGWHRDEQTQFDILPLAIQVSGEAPRLFELPREVVLEVPLAHPEYPWFADLELKWYALPVIANMRLEIGGLSFPAAPFNGFYMSTEIGARNLGDEARYNLLPTIAQRLGLSTRSDRSLWKDRALLELNIAVLHSFKRSGVTIVDHHTAARQFEVFAHNEQKARRRMYADWGWIVPPMSASTTPVFHRSYSNRVQTPNFFYQPSLWMNKNLELQTQAQAQAPEYCPVGVHCV
ncbi:MAG: nitric oxide synthase oxygenase [Ktedonobacteraceae bacterium]